jgi:hypothetical protein
MARFAACWLAIGLREWLVAEYSAAIGPHNGVNPGAEEAD